MKRGLDVYWLRRLRRQWILTSAAKVLFNSISVAAAITALLFRFYGLGISAFAICFCLAFAVLSLVDKYWTISLDNICSFVNKTYPEVEESAGLFLIPEAERSGLQLLQLERLKTTVLNPYYPFKQLRSPMFCFALSLIFLYIVYQIPEKGFSPAQEIVSEKEHALIVKEQVLTEISNYSISITPPQYTGKSSRLQKQFTILAEQGALVDWEIETSKAVESITFIWNDKQQIKMIKADQAGKSWKLSRMVSGPGFYQVVLDGKKSDLYQLEIIADQPVAITVTKPQQHSTIDVGQPKQVNLRLMLTDDYGIADGFIAATVASGKGEAINFKEQKVPLNIGFKNQKRVQLSQQLLLSSMGLKPGDELYFYINAKDNRGQQSRSDVYFVSIQDTTELMSMAGIDNGVNLVPAYFRSQRQLIIDTEKLLKDRGTLTEAEFKARSNELGADQKMLRLRYGKFLGEESESNIGAGHDDKANTLQYGNVEGVLDQYADKHDQAEDATFFEPEMKAHLKATLTEMWNSELHLRTFAPTKALPFEYKALRLLKDLQQKSRAFVAKTGIKTTPLDIEKRLSAELVDVKGSTNRNRNRSDTDHKLILQESLNLLEDKLAGRKSTPAAVSTLQSAEQQLLQAAATSPSKFLAALKALRIVIRDWKAARQVDTEIALAEQGINILIGKKEVQPLTTRSQTSDLTDAYFKQLNRGNR